MFFKIPTNCTWDVGVESSYGAGVQVRNGGVLAWSMGSRDGKKWEQVELAEFSNSGCWGAGGVKVGVRGCIQVSRGHPFSDLENAEEEQAWRRGRWDLGS